MGLFDKVFGSHSDKELKRISKTVDKIEALDESPCRNCQMRN